MINSPIKCVNGRLVTYNPAASAAKTVAAWPYAGTDTFSEVGDATAYAMFVAVPTGGASLLSDVRMEFLAGTPLKAVIYVGGVPTALGTGQTAYSGLAIDVSGVSEIALAVEVPAAATFRGFTPVVGPTTSKTGFGQFAHATGAAWETGVPADVLGNGIAVWASFGFDGGKA